MKFGVDITRQKTTHLIITNSSKRIDENVSILIWWRGVICIGFVVYLLGFINSAVFCGIITVCIWGAMVISQSTWFGIPRKSIPGTRIVLWIDCLCRFHYRRFASCIHCKSENSTCEITPCLFACSGLLRRCLNDEMPWF